MKQRIDELLVEKKLFVSRTRAQAAIMAGEVLADEQKITKPGTKVSIDSKIRLLGEPQKYVSRGGLKLERAIKDFNIDPKGRVAIDVGASTGGFTDCLLQMGAGKVYAVDVGYGQLAWKLRQDERVVVLEKVNARSLKPDILYKDKGPFADMAVIDVSFISIGKILPALYDLLSAEADIAALIKPQFEAEREQVGKGGIIKDPLVHRQVLKKIAGESAKNGFIVKNMTASPISGADGNREFFIHLKKGDKGPGIDVDATIDSLLGAV